MTVPLDYAVPVPLLRRKGFRRLLIVVVVLMSLGVGAFLSRHWVVAKYRYSMWLKYERLCLDYVVPPGQILYTEEAGQIAGLRARPEYMLITTSSSGPPPWKYDYVSRLNETLRRYMEYGAPTSAARLLAVPTTQPIVYLHGVKVPTGEEFLVSIFLTEHSDEKLNFFGHVMNLEKPAAGGVVAYPGLAQHFHFITPLPLRGNALRLYAGTPDGPDGMKFTIVYEVNGKAGHIQGEFTPGPGGVRPGYPNWPTPKMRMVDGPLK